MKRIWLLLVIITIIVAVGLAYSFSYKGETLVKQGVLVNVELSGEVSMVLTFADGMIITVKESNTEDALEMIDYLNNWIGEEMVLEYTYHSDINGWEIDSVSYPT